MAKKLFYRIGEACKQLGIQPYVLRYWETEFPVLNPKKSKSGQRVYSGEELRLIQRIKELLYEEGYTIAGAKKKLESELAGGGGTASPEEPEDGAAEEEPDPLGGTEGEADDDAGPALDSSPEKRVQQLEEGLREALREARGILELLDSP